RCSSQKRSVIARISPSRLPSFGGSRTITSPPASGGRGRTSASGVALLVFFLRAMTASPRPGAFYLHCGSPSRRPSRGTRPRGSEAANDVAYQHLLAQVHLLYLADKRAAAG